VSDEALDYRLYGYFINSGIHDFRIFIFVDQVHWYDHNGVEGAWDLAATGTTNFDLRNLNWATTTLATTI